MAAVSKIEQGVVELRTDVGRLYVRPTGWQRLYLRWTFRNFHSLSLQILNRRQKQLIENLSRSAILTAAENVPATAVIGIVENMTVLALPSTAEMAEAASAVKPAVAGTHLAVLQGAAEEQVLESSTAASEQERFSQKAATERPITPEIFHETSAEHTVNEHEEFSEHAPQAEHGIGKQTGQRKPWALAFALAGAAAAVLLAFWLA